MSAPAIALYGVACKFQDRRGGLDVLAPIDLEVRAGEFLCLVGPSGCGKSTLLNLMAGLERPDHGQLLFEGAPIDGPGPDRAVMFQEHGLFPWRNVAENVAYPLERAGWSRTRVRARVEELLRLVHLSRFAGSDVRELSGGRCQQVALARALACDPKVLLMDEPFAALDAQTRARLVAELQRVWFADKRTVVFVTRDVHEAVVLGTRVAVLATRPGRSLRLHEIELPQPRSLEDRDVALLAARVGQELKAEIEREELGDDDCTSTNRLARPPGGPLAGGR